MRRWPQPAIARSCAPRRRAYSIPSSSLTQLSLAPQRQSTGHVIRSSSVSGSVPSSARPAWRVFVWNAGPVRNASAMAGSSAEASPTPHQPNATRRPSSESAQARRYGATTFPGWTSPIRVTVTRPRRVDEPMPAAAASTTPRTASGRRTAARKETVPPSECPIHTARSAPSASARAKTASTSESRCPASSSGSECPCPGRSGTRTR
jgi:hypothetical protein